MNKLLFSTILVAVTAFAQDATDPFATINEPAPAPVIDPAPEAPAPEATTQTPAKENSNSPFDMLRGHAYNPYATRGAANNIYNIRNTPSLIYGEKFAYIAPVDKIGFAAFDLMGGTTMIGLDNSYGTGSVNVGYANSAFGAVIEFAFNKMWETERINDKNVSTSRTGGGDKIAAYFSMPFGLYANASWLTFGREGGDDITNDYSQLDLQVGYSQGETFVWDAYLNVRRYGMTATADSKTATSADNYFLASANFDVGFRAVDTPTGRVQIGSNNSIGYIAGDEAKNDTDTLDADNIIYLKLNPTILGEVVLVENLLAFAGASQNLWLQIGDGDRIEDTSRSILQQKATNAFGGLRYQKTNWALETLIASNIFGVMNGQNVTASFGGFVYF